MGGCIMRIECLYVMWRVMFALESNMLWCDGDDICSCGSPLPRLCDAEVFVFEAVCEKGMCDRRSRRGLGVWTWVRCLVFIWWEKLLGRRWVSWWSDECWETWDDSWRLRWIFNVETKARKWWDENVTGLRWNLKALLHFLVLVEFCEMELWQRLMRRLLSSHRYCIQQISISSTFVLLGH
jgi:hypothetical protein